MAIKTPLSAENFSMNLQKKRIVVETLEKYEKFSNYVYYIRFTLSRTTLLIHKKQP